MGDIYQFVGATFLVRRFAADEANGRARRVLGRWRRCNFVRYFHWTKFECPALQTVTVEIVAFDFHMIECHLPSKPSKSLASQYLIVPGIDSQERIVVLFVEDRAVVDHCEALEISRLVAIEENFPLGIDAYRGIREIVGFFDRMEGVHRGFEEGQQWLRARKIAVAYSADNTGFHVFSPLLADRLGRAALRAIRPDSFS